MLLLQRPTRSALAIVEKSIAVLPFENRSEDKANAYFADGIQDEILTRLASIADLKVISRSSTQQYQSKPRNLRDIAKQLGVANVLEGSVQKVADQVRVNVQLINAQSDSHLWAESYDRKLTDIFGVETEIAKRIAESLQARLSGRAEQALAAKPTNNPKAYDAYLRGMAFEARSHYPFFNGELLSKAIGFYERAVQLDPNFATAWARLSLAYAFLSFTRDDPTHATEGEGANHALKNAQRLEPNLPETLFAQGYYQYWTLRDYGAARMTFERVIKISPASSEVLQALGRIAQREGHWDQSVVYREKALALDPRNVQLLMDASWTYCMLRQFPAALKLYDRTLDITPNNPDVMALKASVFQAQGDLKEAARLLLQINELSTSEMLGVKINQLRLERNYGEAVRFLQARLAQFHFASQSEKAFVQVELALTQPVAGDMAGSKVTAEEAHDTIERMHRNSHRIRSPSRRRRRSQVAISNR
jgi:TolB-like protein/Tfp pilus assembly protein PilF